MLKGKTILLGVTGSIAAYKAANLASMLKKQHADVHVLMTSNAAHFINPITFETLTGNKCLIDTFDRNFTFEVEHISLAKRADFVLVAPASANVIGKIASGIADDMLTTTIMACTCEKAISPAMNTNMYQNPIVQDNLQKLRQYGYHIIEPAVGRLACGDTGTGKMPPEDVLLETVLYQAAKEKDMKGIHVLVTAGATREAIDPVRYLTNHSTGKMGYALARAAAMRGAKVTLVSGKTSIPKPQFVDVIDVTSAEDMFRAVKREMDYQDIIIKAAAVADYTPLHVSEEKIKKSDGEMSLPLGRTTDILAYLGKHKRDGQFLCGFSMETEHVIEHSREKLRRKNADLICANSLRTEGAGFAGDTNILTLIDKENELALEKLSKDDAAHRVLDRILELRAK